MAMIMHLSGFDVLWIGLNAPKWQQNLHFIPARSGGAEDRNDYT
jgi:hypothetical protein